MLSALTGSAWILFGYLLLCGLLFGEIGLRRGWPMVSALAICGGMLWLGGSLFYAYRPEALGAYVLYLMLGAAWQMAVLMRMSALESVWRFRFTNIAFILTLLAAVLLCVRSGYSQLAMAAVFVLYAGLIVFQRVRTMGRRSLLITTLGAFFTLLFWPSAAGLASYALFAVGLLALYGISSWRALPAWPWAAACSFLAAIGYLIAYLKWSWLKIQIYPAMAVLPVYPHIIWSEMALLLAAFFAMLGIAGLQRFQGHWWQAEEAIGVSAASVAFFVAVALLIHLSGGWLALALAAEILLLLSVSRIFPLPALRHAAAGLAGFLLLCVVASEFGGRGGGIAGAHLPLLLFPAAVLLAAGWQLRVVQPLWHHKLFDGISILFAMTGGYAGGNYLVGRFFPDGLMWPNEVYGILAAGLLGCAVAALRYRILPGMLKNALK